MTRGRRIVRSLAIALAFFPVAGTLAALLGRAHWVLELFTHFPLQYAAALAVALALAAVARAPWVAASIAVPFLWNASALVPLYTGRPAAPANEARLRIASVNLLTSNRNADAVLAWLAKADPDVVLAMEVDGEWVGDLGRSTTHEYVSLQPREDNFGIALLVRRGEAKRVQWIRVTDAISGPGGVPAVDAEVLLGDRAMRLLGLHTLPPVSSGYATSRDRQLRAAARWARGHRQSAIVGDFNVTRWSPRFRDLLRAGGLVDSERGWGWQPSFPAAGFPYSLGRIPIDHCVHTKDLVVTRRELGPAVGSDHFPLLIELARR